MIGLLCAISGLRKAKYGTDSDRRPKTGQNKEIDGTNTAISGTQQKKTG
jgi:hypothetical protein